MPTRSPLSSVASPSSSLDGLDLLLVCWAWPRVAGLPPLSGCFGALLLSLRLLYKCFGLLALRAVHLPGCSTSLMCRGRLPQGRHNIVQ